MALTEIPLNLSALGTASPPLPFNTSSSTTDILNNVISTSNAITNGYLAYGIMLTLFAILYLTLSDKTQFGDFLYSDSRALGIAFGIVSIFGMVLIQVGFITNFKAVAVMCMSFVLVNILILLFENKD